MDNDELTETDQPQPDDAEKVNNLKEGITCRQGLTGDDTHSSARVPEGPGFGYGSCVERLSLAIG